jgi:hypothetical protein
MPRNHNGAARSCCGQSSGHCVVGLLLQLIGLVSTFRFAYLLGRYQDTFQLLTRRPLVPMYDYLDMMDGESMVCYRHLVTGLGMTPSTRPRALTHTRAAAGVRAHTALASNTTRVGNTMGPGAPW